MSNPIFLPALRKTVAYFGSQHKAARHLRVPQSSLNYWLSGKTTKMDFSIPRRAEKATGGEVKAVEFI